MKKILTGLSLRPDKHFVRNLVIVIGIVLVWRGVWHLADSYLFPNNDLLSSLFSLVSGILILYLPDGHLEALGSSKEKEEPLLNHTIRDTLIIATVATVLVISLFVVLFIVMK